MRKEEITEQQANQLLEEMGLPSTFKCPICNEILIIKLEIRKTSVGISKIYKCSLCGNTFNLIKCNLCKKTRYDFRLGVCYDCFQRSSTKDLESLAQKSDKFNKLILISKRKKPDLAFHMTNRRFSKIRQTADKLNISLKTFITQACDEKVKRS